MHQLRPQAEVRAHTGDVVTGEEFNDLRLAGAALELHHLGAAFLHQSHGVLQRFVLRRVGHERHVRHRKGVTSSFRDSAAVIMTSLNVTGTVVS